MYVFHHRHSPNSNSHPIMHLKAVLLYDFIRNSRIIRINFMHSLPLQLLQQRPCTPSHRLAGLFYLSDPFSGNFQFEFRCVNWKYQHLVSGQLKLFGYHGTLCKGVPWYTLQGLKCQNVENGVPKRHHLLILRMPVFIYYKTTYNETHLPTFYNDAV